MSAPANNIKAAVQKSNSAFKALVNAMGNNNVNIQVVKNTHLPPAVNAIRNLKKVYAAAPPNVAANVLGSNVPPEGQVVNALAHLRTRLPSKNDVINAAAYLAAVQNRNNKNLIIASNRKIGKGLFGYKNKEVGAFWKSVDAALAGAKTANANSTVVNFKTRIPRTSNGTAFNIAKYLNNKPNVNANRLIGRGGKFAMRKYQNENLRKFWTNVNAELKKRGKPVPNAAKLNAASANVNINTAGASGGNKEKILGAMAKAKRYMRVREVASMSKYLKSNKGLKNKGVMANAFANRKGANKSKSLDAKWQALVNALGGETPDPNAVNVIKRTSPNGKTNYKIILNALSLVEPEPVNKAGLKRNEQITRLMKNTKLFNKISEQFRKFSTGGGIGMTNAAVVNAMRNDKGTPNSPLGKALAATRPLGTALGIRGQNWSVNTFKAFLNSKYGPAPATAAAVAAPVPKSRANVNREAKEAAQQAAIAQLTNKNWFKNYPANKPKAKAEAYLRQSGLNGPKFKNDMNLMAIAAGNNPVGNTNAARIAAIRDLLNTAVDTSFNASVQPKLKALRINRTALTPATPANPVDPFNSLGLKVGETGISPEQKAIIKNLANGLQLNSTSLAAIKGLNLTKNDNKAYALRILVNGLRSTSAGYEALKKSNMEPQYKKLLQTYLNTYTKSAGLRGRLNRTVKPRTPYRKITKNEAIAAYLKQRNAGAEASAARNAIRLNYPSNTFNWSQAIAEINKNETFKKANPAWKNYLP